MEINRFKHYTLLILSTLGLALFSCDDDDLQSDEVVLNSFGPSGVQHGETIRFIGENLDQVDTIEFAPGVFVFRESFESQSSRELQVQVPEEAMAGKVMLHIPGEDIETKTVLSFEVIFTITDMTAEARPESLVTFKGTYLNWIESVWFNKDLEVTEFESQSDTELVVMVPKEAKTGILTLQGGGTDPQSFNTESELVVSLPAVSALNPAAVKHADNLTIEGSNLDLIKEVIFPDGSVVAEFVSVSSSELVLTVPVTATDGVLTFVVYSLLEVETDQELTIVLPQETELTPSPVEEGGELTISGTNLDLVASLVFPGVSEGVSAFVSHTATEMKVIVPKGTITGFMKFITIHDFVVTMSHQKVVMPGEGPVPLTFVLYNDALENGWQDWSGTADVANTENVFDGTSAIKFSFAGGWESWGGGFWPDPASTVGYTEFVLYVYGGSGAAGKINLIVNPGTWDDRNAFDVEEGKWIEVSYPLADLVDASDVTNPGTWSEIWLQAQGINGDVYFDFIGFR